MQKISMRCGVVMMVVVASACGGSSSPEEKCEDLLETLCDRLTSCLDLRSEKNECISAGRQSLPCGSATSVTASYDRCMDQLEDVSCDALLDSDAAGDPVIVLPDSCRSVIELGGLGAPSTSFGAQSSSFGTTSTSLDALGDAARLAP